MISKALKGGARQRKHYLESKSLDVSYRSIFKPSRSLFEILTTSSLVKQDLTCTMSLEPQLTLAF